MPSQAFILAAGLGARLRPYTNDSPKPLVKVSERSLLDRTLDHLTAAGISKIILNTHYLAGQIKTTVKARPEFQAEISYEPELLDTGGGIKNLVQQCDNTFFVLSGDGLWEDDANQNTLKAMAEAWDPESMDILILLQPVDSMELTKGVGDYDIDENGLPKRSSDKTGGYMFTSMRINHKRIFDDTPDGAFSYLNLLDKAQDEGRLHAIIHQGDWHHISTPDDLEAVDKAYKGRGK